jgi:hypothetical protein
METTTAAVLALAQTHAAATKELAEYLEKRNTELGQLRAQVAERDKALAAYDAAQYSLDELRKKGTKDAAKGTAAEEKARFGQGRVRVDAQDHRRRAARAAADQVCPVSGALRRVSGRSDCLLHWHAQRLAAALSGGLCRHCRRADARQHSREAPPVARQVRQEVVSKDEQRALKNKLADEKKRVKAEKKAHRQSGAALGARRRRCRRRRRRAARVPGVQQAQGQGARRQRGSGALHVQDVHRRASEARSRRRRRMAATTTTSRRRPRKPPSRRQAERLGTAATAAKEEEEFCRRRRPTPTKTTTAPAASGRRRRAGRRDASNDDDPSPPRTQKTTLDLESDTDVSDDDDNELAHAPSTVTATKSTAAALLIDDPFADDPFAMSSGAVLQPTPDSQADADRRACQPTPVLQPTHPAKPTRKVSQPVLPNPDAIAATTTSRRRSRNFHAPSSTDLTRRAGSWLSEAIKQLESGSFADAMLSANEAILCAAPACAMAAKGGTADELNQRRTELRMCVAYELATRVLCHVGLDRNYPVSGDDTNETLRATRARFLADIPLRTAHRAACVRAGLKINADAKNWGAAADLIKMLLPLDPPDKERLMEQGRYCQAQGMTNAQFTPYKFMCFKQMRPITDAPMRCNVCNALFASATVRGRSQCPICKHGECAPLQ